MSDAMVRRSPDEGEWDEITGEAAELAWTVARRLAGLGPDEVPLRPDESLPPDQAKAARLARLAALRLIADACEDDVEDDVRAALDNDATFAEIAEAWRVSEQTTRNRWGRLARAGDRVVVVISRRNKVHHDAEDFRGSYGEVGGKDQYRSDRGAWEIGSEVRRLARHAVIGVEGRVERAYLLDPDGWTQDGAKWWFTGTLLTPEEAAAAHAAGDLPFRLGDPCPTRRGKAYRPHWFR